VVADLTGKSILVVGASSGIGRAIGLLSAAAGADVAFAARRIDRLEQAAAEAGGNSFALACDVRHPEECQRVSGSPIRLPRSSVGWMPWCTPRVSLH
jgi:NADP-dependent 3-hydroxy acid dehydrogenase YdfG